MKCFINIICEFKILEIENGSPLGIIGYTPRARLLNYWATKPEVCNQLVL